MDCIVQYHPDNCGIHIFDYRCFPVEEGENIVKLIVVLIPLILIGLVFFVFAGPAVLDGTLGQKHYTVKGIVTLIPPPAIVGGPLVQVSQLQSNENLMLLNVQGVPLCIIGQCSGTNIKVCIDSKCQDLGSWGIGFPVTLAVSREFSINGVSEGSHNLSVKVFGTLDEGVVAEISQPITVPVGGS